MRLLIDENVPDSVSKFLRERGHEVDLVRDSLGQMTPDEFVAWVGDDLGAIVVTIDKDFKSLVSRMPTFGRRRFTALGRISLRCRETQALSRMQEFIEEIEREYDRLQGRSDKRLIVEITVSSYRIIR
jgi:predicted nuclease of predicted toxin-antitoxin system